MNSLACLAVTQPRGQFTKSSGYDMADAERLKAEQSATSDLPLHALNVEMRSGDNFHSPFAKNPPQHLKRTAIALAALAPQSKTEQSATSSCLPFAGAHFVFGASRPALSNVAPRRRLLPPPKTVILPQGDPAELRLLIQEMQEKRLQAVEEGQKPVQLTVVEECSMTARYPVFSLSALAQQKQEQNFCNTAQSAGPIKRQQASISRALKKVGRLLGDLIDMLAVA